MQNDGFTHTHSGTNCHPLPNGDVGAQLKGKGRTSVNWNAEHYLTHQLSYAQGTASEILTTSGMYQVNRAQSLPNTFWSTLIATHHSTAIYRSCRMNVDIPCVEQKQQQNWFCSQFQDEQHSFQSPQNHHHRSSAFPKQLRQTVEMQILPATPHQEPSVILKSPSPDTTTPFLIQALSWATILFS